MHTTKTSIIRHMQISHKTSTFRILTEDLELQNFEADKQLDSIRQVEANSSYNACIEVVRTNPEFILTTARQFDRWNKEKVPRALSLITLADHFINTVDVSDK